MLSGEGCGANELWLECRSSASDRQVAYGGFSASEANQFCGGRGARTASRHFSVLSMLKQRRSSARALSVSWSATQLRASALR